MKKYFLFILAAFVFENVKAQSTVNIIPRPAEVTIQPGFLVLKEPVAFIIFNDDPGDDIDGMQPFEKYLQDRYAVKDIREGDTHSYGLPTEFFLRTDHKNHPDGYYEIEVKDNSVYITGNSSGRFYAFETLKQLIRRDNKKRIIIPHCSIKDHPRFSYRGMHLDVSRHFFPVPFIKKYIDYLAYYKFNNFHWHLTDDQGWRIEIKKYPLLTTVGSCRAQTLVGNYGTNKYDGEKYCGYYTQKEIREVVNYAKERHINIIPEIEMPGHALAALASYPYLGCTKGPYKTMETWGVSEDVFCAGNDSTYRFIKDVLDEVTALFPSPYIHVGGDECPHERWKTCPVCQQKMKEQGLKNETDLQTYFMNRIHQYLSAKGRRMIGWDEVLEPGVSKDITIMSWRGEEGGIAAAKQGHDVIMTPDSHCYFDRSQTTNEDSITFGGYLPLEKVYSYEPVPVILSPNEAKHIKGAQANVWTEYITNTAKVEYMIFPRMAALAEVLWTPKAKRDWKNFEQRLPAVFNDYKSRGIHYSKAYYDLSATTVQTNDQKIAWQLQTKDPAAKIIYRINDGKEQEYTAPVVISETGKYRAFLADKKDQPISSIVSQEFSLNKASGRKISLSNEPAAAYSGNGAFTLVNGIVNTKGMAKSSEFLGFSGKDMEAIIELLPGTEISSVEINTFSQPASWIYPPSSVSVLISDDGVHFNSLNDIEQDVKGDTYIVKFPPMKAGTVKVIAKNAGVIPSGRPGAGNQAWLFVSEIKVF